MEEFLSIDYFDENSLSLFWQKVISCNIRKDIDIYLNYEASSIEAIFSPRKKLLVTMFAFEQGLGWTNMAEDEELDDESYALIMNEEIKKIFELLRMHEPKEIRNIKYLSNWYGNYTYVGSFLKHMEM